MGEYFYRKTFIQKLLNKRRRQRVNFFMSKIRNFPDMSVLDVGCGPDGRGFENFASPDFHIIGIDLFDEAEINISHPDFTYFQQDARDLSRFGDKEFDLAVSIGMMEHICDRPSLAQISSEIIRVSKQHVILVPWRYTWIEPHFKFPLFQFFPYTIRNTLTKIFNLHNLRETVRKNPDYIRYHYQWIKTSEWQVIFPGSVAYVTPTFDTITIIKRHDPDS